MLGRKSKIVKGVLVVAIVLGFVLPASTVFSSSAIEKTEILRIEVDNVQQIDALKSRGAEIIADYNNGYVLVKVREGEGSYFGTFFNVEKTDVWNTIELSPSGISFDTQGALPSVPENLMSKQTTDEYLIQFAGPIMKEWVEEIENLGGDFHSYFRYYSFLVKIPSSEIPAVRNLPYVNWVGSYQPAYKISERLMDGDGSKFIAVYGYNDVDVYDLADKLDSLGATVHTTTSWPTIVLVNADAAIIANIAALPEVMVMYPEGIKETMDSVAGKIHKYHDAWYQETSGLPSTLTGTGEAAGILDSGFDVLSAPVDGHVDFYDSPNGDRIIQYYGASPWSSSNPDGWGYQCEPHGTACAGIVASDGYAWETHYGLSTLDDEWHESEAGVAPEAELTITGAAGNFGAGIWGGYGYTGTACNGMPCWRSMYQIDGAHSISNSWGGTSPYNQAIDQYTDQWNDLLIIMAAGNNGPSSDSINEGLALNKNGLSVGASLNYRPAYFSADNPNLIADFSSRGGIMTSGGRIKPDIVAIGTAGISTMGPYGYRCNEDYAMFKQGVPQPDYIMVVDEYNYTVLGPGQDEINDYRYFSGTSQAAPMASGNYLLIREYLREVEGIADPTTDLAKAFMINGAVRMDEDLYDYPGWDQGWGRVNVQESLFPTPPRTNQFVRGQFNDTAYCDLASGTCNDSTKGDLYGSINTNVVSSDVPLKATLVWIDYQGENLVRDLNLKLVSPSGVEYWGNFYGLNNASNKGWSIPNPSVPAAYTDNDKLMLWDSDMLGWDDVNNIEQVEVKYPEPGIWTVNVTALGVPIGVANFSVVFAADIGPQTSYDVDLRSEYPPAVSVVLGGAVTYPFTVTNYGSVTDDVDLLATSGLLNVEFKLTATLSNLAPLESRDSLAVIEAKDPGLTPGVYPVVLKGISANDPSPIKAQDSIELTVEVLATAIPSPIQITTETTNDKDPSVLVLDDGTTKHIFIAYIKTIPTNLGVLPRLGGETVWLAYSTLDDEGNLAEPWNFTVISDLNEFPVDLRFNHFKPNTGGPYEGRVVLTWTGKDPSWPSAKQQFDLGSWGRIAYSDPPYDTWNFGGQVGTNPPYIDENQGEQATNSKRVSFTIIRETTQELIYVFEYLGSTDSESPPTIVQTWWTVSTDGGQTWPSPPTWPKKLFPTQPGDNRFYFFPTGCVDQNDVAWVFVYYRLPAGNDRDLTVRLYDGTWSSNPMLWDTADNVQFPSCMSTAEGPAGNRIYFTVTRDQQGSDFTIWLSWTDGDYTSAGPPAEPLPGEFFSPSFYSVGPLPPGPYTVSLSDANYNRGPLMVLLNTTEPCGEKTWIAYMENSHLQNPPWPANPYGVPNLWTMHSCDNFATQPGLIRVTADAFAKGHRMADALQIGAKGVVYEVFHANKGGLDAVDYNVYLTIYSQDWDTKPDLLGPITSHVNVIPNPFNVSSETDFLLTANINDVLTGMSNIADAKYTETPTSVSDPEAVDWGLAIPMDLYGIPPKAATPTEIANATVTPVAWNPGEVHRFWVCGKDDVGNWGCDGEADYVDIYVIGGAGIPPGAPTLLSVELSGAVKEDVTLTWTLSPDDGGGAFDVNGYEIYAGNIYHTGRLGYSLVNSVAAGVTTYAHPMAGVGNLNHYFYVVVAKDTEGFSTASAEQGAKLANYYTTGAHLISIPLNMTTTDLPTILSTLTYTVAWWYDPMDLIDPWKAYHPLKGVGDLSSYNRTMGIWINVPSDNYLTVAGMVPTNTTINLQAGWNLIGYPAFSSREVGDVFSLIIPERLEGFDPLSPPEYLKLMDDSDLMTPCYGYWIKVDAPTTFWI